MKRSFALLLIMISLLVWAVPVQAATVPEGFETWTQQTTSDTYKVWTIQFSAAADADSIDSKNIYVTDDNNQLVRTTLTRSSDGTSVRVAPVSSYVTGKQYWLFMTDGITTDSGERSLSKPAAMPFLITEETQISSVTDKYSDLLTSFTVVTSQEVCSVKINQTDMIYKGNNTFSLGMTELEQGSNVTVRAYDGDGKVLETQTYTVK